MKATAKRPVVLVREACGPHAAQLWEALELQTGRLIAATKTETLWFQPARLALLAGLTVEEAAAAAVRLIVGGWVGYDPTTESIRAA